MYRNDRRSRGTDSKVRLPETANKIARDHPALWAAFQRLGEEASRAGPLDDRTRRLVHLAYAIAADSEGATHSHARRARGEGLSPEELDHVALLAVTTLGWSGAIKGLSWVRDVRARASAGRRRVAAGMKRAASGSRTARR
jgi:alkylhydroperoxidase/carboxymuconolactone decarboxylase family protein YurZ